MSRGSFLSRFLNGKGFYVALGICMIAIGISAWSAMSSLSDESTQIASSEPSVSMTETVSEAPANKTQSDVEDTRSEQKEKPVEVSSKQTVSTVTQPVARFFTYPVSGEVIKKFSDSELQYSVTYNDMRLHPGIDIKSKGGTAVKSAGDGTVLSVENDQNLGYTVKIDHGNGVTGVYAGLTKAVAVKKGDTVKSGTTLGPLGTVTNECLDAPHLHLEFLKDGKQIDPLTLLSE